MLTELYIQNIAVIQKASISFTPGFNVFTGETGAGKTILISAINAVLGERTSREMIRSGEEKAFVSALFEDLPAETLEALAELGYPAEDGSVLIAREIAASGKTGCKISGAPATLPLLREIASRLIHIHGQGDSQQLLAPQQHLAMIDAFGELAARREEYHKAYRRMCELGDELDSLTMDEAQKARRIDLLRYQLNEIEAAQIDDPDEEDELQSQKKLIRNSERVLEWLSGAYDALQGGEDGCGIETLFEQLTDGVQNAGEYIEDLLPMSARLEEMRYELSDFGRELGRKLDGFAFDPRELEQIEQRLDLFYGLKRKYGPDLAAILEYEQKAREELSTIESSDQRCLELERLLGKAREEARALADELSRLRRLAADDFIARVEAELAFLDMPSVKLSLHMEETDLSPTGGDTAELYIVTNVGEQPKPLSKVASGGEVSRIMLAVKQVLAGKDDIGTLIFDEVDMGVSGRAAQKIGQKLKEASRSRQVICVTHLAQVAAFADHHLHICKEVAEGRTFTRVQELDREGRVREIARIIGGEPVTELTKKSAEELLIRSAGAL